MCMFVHVHAHVCVCACTCVSACMCTCMYVSVCMCVHTCVHACLCVQMCACVRVCLLTDLLMLQIFPVSGGESETQGQHWHSETGSQGLCDGAHHFRPCVQWCPTVTWKQLWWDSFHHRNRVPQPELLSSRKPITKHLPGSAGHTNPPWHVSAIIIEHLLC